MGSCIGLYQGPPCMFTTHNIHHVQAFSLQFNSFNYLSWPSINGASRLERSSGYNLKECKAER